MSTHTPQSIKSNIIGTQDIEWKKLKFLQQPEFKEWMPSGDEKLIESLLRYQFVDPFKVWVNDGNTYCLDGFHRYQDLATLERMGVNVPEMLPATFIQCSDITEAAKLVLVFSSAYARITQQGMFDFVSNYKIDMKDIETTMNIPEFSMDRFKQKFDHFGVNDLEEYEVDIEGDEIIVKPGDIFLINGHRIMCGDFKDPAVVDQLMEGKKARILHCDPPYNLPMNVFTNTDSKRHEDFAMGVGEMSDVEYIIFLSLVMQRGIDHTVPGAIHFIFMDWRHIYHMAAAGNRAYGSPTPKQLCVWVKDRFANGSFYRSQQELCFIFSNLAAKHLWNKDLLDEGGNYKTDDELVYVFKNGDAAPHLSHLALKDRIRSNVWRYPSANSMKNPDRYELHNHPTPKPVAMVADCILDTTNPGEIVADWFLGSGTTVIASEKTDRICYGLDIEPKFIQSIVKRCVLYSEKNGKALIFSHVNGSLTLNDFTNANRKQSEANH